MKTVINLGVILGEIIRTGSNDYKYKRDNFTIETIGMKQKSNLYRFELLLVSPTRCLRYRLSNKEVAVL